MNPRLDDARAKLAWGRHHIKDLKQAIADSEPHVLRIQPEPERLTDALADELGITPTADVPGVTDSFVVIRVRAVTVSEPPTEISLIIGDVLNNLRAALDYAAWELVQVGDKPNPERPQSVVFPISLQEKGWKSFHTERLPGVTGPAVDAIRTHQPFLRRKQTHEHPLARLAYLGGRDKHRRVTVVNASNSWGRFALKLSDDFKPIWEIKAPIEPVIEPGQYITNFFGIEQGDGWRQIEVMEQTCSAGLAFEKIGFVETVIDEIDAEVDAVLKALDPLTAPTIRLGQRKRPHERGTQTGAS